MEYQIEQINEEIFTKNIETIDYDKYRDYEAINQSLLKDLYFSPEKVGIEKDTKGIKLGSIVDAIVFNTFEDEYIICDVQVPTGTIKDIIEALWIEGLDFTDDNIVNKVREFGWHDNWGKDTVVNKVREGVKSSKTAGNKYFTFLNRSDGKTVVNEEDYNEAYLLADHFKRNYRNEYKDSEYQNAYVGDLKFKNNDMTNSVFKIKGLMDMEDDDFIYDMKVIGQDPRSFGYNYFLKYRYDIQALQYYLFKGKKMIFLLLSTKYPNLTIKRSITNHQLIRAISGFTYNNRYYPGYKDLIKNYYRQYINDFVEYPIYVKEQNYINYEYEHIEN